VFPLYVFSIIFLVWRNFEWFPSSTRIQLGKFYIKFQTGEKQDCFDDCVSNDECVAASYFQRTNMCFYFNSTFYWELFDEDIDGLESIIYSAFTNRNIVYMDKLGKIFKNF
jgi:hypothetical protein